ncbi:hypothetical protein BGW37DRAFT_507439 [Umbelopsis sp. PMI_123]|nr:hypothetical protein BGW37DRAFT_507439 [Umbelopsis sp. PMI_123]
MVIFKETAVPIEYLDFQAQNPSVIHIPNSNHASTSDLRGSLLQHQYASLQPVKLGSTNAHVLLQITEDGKTLKVQFLPLVKYSGSALGGYSARLSGKTLHLVFNSYIIPDVFIHQDTSNQTMICWILTGNEDLHRLQLPSPDQLHLFSPMSTNHSVQHLNSLSGRYPTSLKAVNSNAVAVACQDGAIVHISMQIPNRIIGNTVDPHLRELQETVLNKSSSVKRSSSLFDNLKNLVGHGDVHPPSSALNEDVSPNVIHSISHPTNGDWIISLLQNGKLQMLPTQPSYDRKPFNIDWQDALGETDPTLLERSRSFMHSHTISDNRFQVLILIVTINTPIIYSFTVSLEDRQPVWENGWIKKITTETEGEIVGFMSQKETINGSDQTALWILWNTDSEAEIDYSLVDSADVSGGRWRKVDVQYDKSLPEENIIQQFVQSAALESSMPHARALLSHMRFSKFATKVALKEYDASATPDSMLLDPGSDDLLTNVSDSITRKFSGGQTSVDTKREWRKFMDLCIHWEAKRHIPISLQMAGPDDKTPVVLKNGSISILRRINDLEILHCYSNQRDDQLVVSAIELVQSELQHPQMADIIARASVLKVLDTVAHLVQAFPSLAIQQVDEVFLDILKKPIRDSIDTFAQEFYQVALQPTLSTMEDGDIQVTQFLAEWRECPNASEAVNWLLEQFAVSEPDSMMEQDDDLTLRSSNFVDQLIISTFKEIIFSRYELSRNIMIALVLIFAANKSDTHLVNASNLLAYSVATATSTALMQWTIVHSSLSDENALSQSSTLLQKDNRPNNLLHLLVEMYSQVKVDQNFTLAYLATNGAYNLIQNLGIFKRTTQVVTTMDMVRFANILEVYGYTSTAFGFASMLNAGPGVYYIMGKCALKNNKISESVEYFERAAAGMVGSVSSDDESYLPQLLPNEIIRDGLWHYYHHIAEMFTSRNLVEQAAHFDSLALQSLDSKSQAVSTTVLLQRNLFQHKLELGAFEEAYSLVMTSSDEQGKPEQARQLVFVLCQKKQDKLLCKLGFDNFQTEVKNSLIKLAEISDIEEMRRYWKLLYSYAVMRRDYSTGAFAMYMYAKRLDLMLIDRDTIVEQVRGYLVAKNTLALLSSIDAHISVTIPQTLNNTQTPKVISVRVGDIDKELIMSKARLAASEASMGSDVQPIQIPEAYATYIREKKWDDAFYVARLFSFDTLPIFEAIITHCIYNMKLQPNREGAWQLLREYLEAMPKDQNYKYYDFCLEKMLDYTGTDLPWWMVQRYEKYDPEALIRSYLRYGDSERATTLMIRRINKQNDHIQVSPATSSRWMPYTLIDSILKDLQTDIQNAKDDAMRRRLQRLQAQLDGALNTYFETIRRETNMLVNKPSVERAKRLRV